MACVDYVLGSVLTLAEREGADPAARVYGVVGAGQVGGRLVNLLRGLGCRCGVCDPPRQVAEGGDFDSLEQIIDECDVISLHTPLDVYRAICSIRRGLPHSNPAPG